MASSLQQPIRFPTRNSLNNNKNGKHTKKKFKKRKKNLKKNKNDLLVTRQEAEAPKSFIIVRGRVTKYCKLLRNDLRLIFTPFTANKLKEKQSNSLKDYKHAAQEFGVTHLISLSQSDIKGTMLRIIRLPNGPTFWFKIQKYSLIKDIIYLFNNNYNNKNKFKFKWNIKNNSKNNNNNISKLPYNIQFALRFPPLVILNGFSSPSPSSKNSETETETFNRCSLYHLQLISTMFKHMFIPINIANIKLTECKRIIFFNYNPANDNIDIRHYKIQLAQNLKNINKNIKKIIKYKNKLKKNDKNRNKNDLNSDKYPDLSKYDDIEDYVKLNNNNNYESESEFDDDENTKIIINKINKNKNNLNSNSSFVRLKEIGPRIQIELYKIEELVSSGAVLYHRFINKTEKEKIELEIQKNNRILLKKKRKLNQEINIQKKKNLKKDKLNKRLEKRKSNQVEQLLKSFDIDDNDDNNKKRKKFNYKKNKNNNNQPLRKKRKLNK